MRLDAHALSNRVLAHFGSAIRDGRTSTEDAFGLGGRVHLTFVRQEVGNGSIGNGRQQAMLGMLESIAK